MLLMPCQLAGRSWLKVLPPDGLNRRTATHSLTESRSGRESIRAFLRNSTSSLRISS